MNIELLVYLFRSDLTQAEVAAKVGCNESYVSKTWAKYYTKEERTERKRIHYSKSKLGDKNPMKGKTKENHPNYKGPVSDNKGYLLIVKPDWFTGRKRSKHVFLHHVVLCEALGLTELPKGFVVHHIDNDPLNNNLNNLALLSSDAHTRLHRQQG